MEAFFLFLFWAMAVYHWTRAEYYRSQYKKTKEEINQMFLKAINKSINENGKSGS
jgi:hypothetical protein